MVLDYAEVKRNRKIQVLLGPYIAPASIARPQIRPGKFIQGTDKERIRLRARRE